MFDLKKNAYALLLASTIMSFAVDDVTFAEEKNSITIDVHTHVFNGEEVPLDGFVEEIVLHTSDRSPYRKLFKGLIKPVTSYIKLFADGHSQENKELTKLQLKFGHVDTKFEVPQPINIETIQLVKKAKVTVKPSEGISSISAVSEFNINEDRAFIKSCKGSGFFNILSVSSWARRFTAPRHCNVRRLLNTHGKKGGVDLFVTAMVDLDYWLKGKTNTHIEEQIVINSKLAILSNGRMLPFVSFDPYRDAADDGKALKLVQKAILEYGFVGVKLYPPMGFKALGNTKSDYASIEGSKAIWRKSRSGVRSFTDEEFAEKIEESLESLYIWANANDVPIMAHANDSNYSREAFQNFADPKHWSLVLKKYENLRINLGHFGGVDSLLKKKKKWAQKIISLMDLYPNLYSDTGNFVLWEKKGFSKYLNELNIQMRDSSNLKKHLMYGSDWFMNDWRSYSKKYPTKFRQALKKSKMPNDIVVNLMGKNAVSFLGLSKNCVLAGKKSCTRDRLRKFYKKYNVRAEWMNKIQ